MATYTFEKLASLVRSLDSLEHRGTPRRPSFQARRSTFGDGSVLAQQIPPPSAAPQTPIQEALQLLPAKPTHFQLALALDALRQSRNNDPRIAANEEDEDEVLLEWTLVGRLVLGLYGAHVEELIQCTGAWEDEIGWWKRLEGRGRWTWGGIAGYFFMSESCISGLEDDLCLGAVLLSILFFLAPGVRRGDQSLHDGHLSLARPRPS